MTTPVNPVIPRSVKEECLSKLILFGEPALRHVKKWNAWMAGKLPAQ